MKYFLLFIFSILIISCSSVESSNGFDYGTDKGYKDLEVVFDDGTDYYISDKKTNLSHFKINLLNKKNKPDVTSTESKPAATSETSSKNNNEKTLKYASNSNITLLYPVVNVSIEKKFDESSFKGLKFKVSSNTEIKPAAPGMVIFSGNKPSLGNTIFVYHNNGYISIYSNLDSLKYKKGDFIRTVDDTLGYASNSFSFELRQRSSKGVVPVNPTKFLKKR